MGDAVTIQAVAVTISPGAYQQFTIFVIGKSKSWNCFRLNFFAKETQKMGLFDHLGREVISGENFAQAFLKIIFHFSSMPSLTDGTVCAPSITEYWRTQLIFRTPLHSTLPNMEVNVQLKRCWTQKVIGPRSKLSRIILVFCDKNDAFGAGLAPFSLEHHDRDKTWLCSTLMRQFV